MNGYFRPKHFGRLRELEPLKLSDIEFVTDDGFTENQYYLGHGWSHQCPRCGEINHVISQDPYCSECNWDALTDAA